MPTLLPIRQEGSREAMKIDVDKLKGKLEAVTQGLGFELAELTAPVVGGRLILRAFIHSPGGVTLDDCARVSREISDYLDTEDLIETRYTLEVSSLGLDRPLLTKRDFQRRIGERVKASYVNNGVQRIIEGILIYCDNIDLKIDSGNETITIPLNANPRGKIII